MATDDYSKSRRLSTLHKKRLLVQRPSTCGFKLKNAGVENEHPYYINWDKKEGTLSSWDLRRNVPDSLCCPKLGLGSKTPMHYNPMVMVGNWAEERLRKNYVPKENLWLNENSKDPGDYDSARSGALQTRIRNEVGASRDYMFKQHDTLYDNNRITTYDENYNQRWKEKMLPNLRHWNFAHVAWLPEKTDHPLFGPSTQCGLLKKKKMKWDKEIIDKSNTYETLYRTNYLHNPSNRYLPLKKIDFSHGHYYTKPEPFMRAIS